jgi:hypothetical protein
MIELTAKMVAQARLGPQETIRASASTTWCGAGTRLRDHRESAAMQRIII